MALTSMTLFFKLTTKKAKRLKTILSGIVNKKYNNLISRNFWLDVLITTNINITHLSLCFQILGGPFL